MQIWPAIDVKSGKCVRLSQGDYQRDIVYGTNPADMASRWVSEGATGLHVIDLDGAMGCGNNLDAIRKIVDETDVEIQVGGGINSQKSIEEFLSMGIKRLVVSTKSVCDPDWIDTMASRYEGHIVVSIDFRNGFVAYDGWRKTSELSAVEHAKSMSSLPLAGLIFTDIDRAGMMSGPNLELLHQLRDLATAPVISSGGVQETDDVIRLNETGVQGCIIGRALYEGKITLPDAINAAMANV